MKHKNNNLGKIFAWFIVVFSSIVNVVLLGNAIKLAFLPDIEVAQAQFLLTYFVIYVGIPISIISAFLVAATLLVKKRNKGLAGVLRYNYGAGMVAFINSIIPLGILCMLYWFMEKWTF